MATFNGEKYLPEQLNSYLVQDRLPDELVVCDDNSTDDSVGILEEFAAKAPFNVVIERNEARSGAVQSFGRALSLASGDLVFLSDQDDVWLPGKVATVLLLQEKHPEKLVFLNDVAICDGDLAATGLTKLGQMKSAGYSLDAFVMGCAAAVRGDLLRLCLPIPRGVPGHDNWLVAFANSLGATSISVDVLQLYRRHGANQSNVLPNRTTPIGRWDRIRMQFGKAVSDDAVRQAAAELDFARQLIGGLERAVGRCDGAYDDRLLYAVERQKPKLEALLFRSNLRARSLPSRLPRALRYWLAGGYKQFNGSHSLIRDIIG
jgi:hypothetical protein